MIRYVKSRRMRLAEYVACIRETNKSIQYSVMKARKTSLFERPRHKLEANNKTDPTET
jgi:hypothetical protein